MKEFDYQPGKIAEYLGVTVPTLKTHLRQNGLYESCIQRFGRLRIPHSVACELLDIPPGSHIPFKKKKYKKSTKKRDYLTMKEVRALRQKKSVGELERWGAGAKESVGALERWSVGAKD